MIRHASCRQNSLESHPHCLEIRDPGMIGSADLWWSVGTHRLLHCRTQSAESLKNQKVESAVSIARPLNECGRLKRCFSPYTMCIKPESFCIHEGTGMLLICSSTCPAVEHYCFSANDRREPGPSNGISCRGPSGQGRGHPHRRRDCFQF